MFKNFYGDKFDDDQNRKNIEPQYEYGNQGLFPYQNSEFKAFRVNIYEMDDYYSIKADLPGVRKKDIEISVKNKKLIIKAVRRKLCDGENNILCQERKLGEYRRIFSFDYMDENNIKAKLKNGILDIKIYKVNEKSNDEVKEIDID